MSSLKQLVTKYFTPGIHILVWVSLLATAAFLFNAPPPHSGLTGNFFLITNIYHIGLFYLNAYYLLPRLFTKRNWFFYILFIPVILIFSYYVKVYFLKLFNPSFELNEINHRIIFFPPVPFLLISILFRVILNKVQREKDEKVKKAERLSSELKFLRSQVSPHFLFNMLTNMVSLARQKSEILEPSLIKLSEFLRYMLYETGGEKFVLSNEITNLKNYIELQQLRFGDEINVQLEIQNENPDCLIEPLLLIPFIENAFKHGPGLVKDPYILIKLVEKNKQLDFSVVNNFNPENSFKDKNSGIGLINVKERLNRVYPKKNTLFINSENGIYTVRLKIDLS